MGSYFGNVILTSDSPLSSRAHSNSLDLKPLNLYSVTLANSCRLRAYYESNKTKSFRSDKAQVASCLLLPSLNSGVRLLPTTHGGAGHNFATQKRVVFSKRAPIPWVEGSHERDGGMVENPVAHIV
ncbi:hypothetical protein CEXT_44331 [Caerostris extrusa]|uniref:Uncharacterized protein n=1 Tax=Caerostris extrusa TaxID=172846 RepID=A0AAV4SVJ4_CAEEX|nr:hypothetical protein CEXT_44331 [Caerostris extrusa]